MLVAVGGGTHSNGHVISRTVRLVRIMTSRNPIPINSGLPMLSHTIIVRISLFLVANLLSLSDETHKLTSIEAYTLCCGGCGVEAYEELKRAFVDFEVLSCLSELIWKFSSNKYPSLISKSKYLTCK